MATHRIIATDKSWIEGAAIAQLEASARLDHMSDVVGLPDLHPGRGYPVGAAFKTQDNMFYPHLIGSDIGCGMRLDRLVGLEARKLNVTKIAKKLRQLEAVEVDFAAEFGYVGGGNHFLEILKVHEIQSSQGEVSSNDVFCLAHSGSRGLGHMIYMQYSAKNQANAVCASSELGQWYLDEHKKAIDWAKMNRSALVAKASSCLGVKSEQMLDIYHNYLERLDDSHWLHRKGAASSHEKLLIIPGSRGDFSYIVRAKAKNESLFSIAHGAGRKWQRNCCKGMLSNFTVQELQKTKLGSVVICEDKELLYEEAPQAYKKSSSVIEDLLAHDLIEVVAILSPVVTYKTANLESE